MCELVHCINETALPIPPNENRRLIGHDSAIAVRYFNDAFVSGVKWCTHISSIVTNWHKTPLYGTTTQYFRLVNKGCDSLQSGIYLIFNIDWTDTFHTERNIDKISSNILSFLTITNINYITRLKQQMPWPWVQIEMPSFDNILPLQSVVDTDVILCHKLT